ncbi:hypothetical protein [Heyndrickxia camelliae]|uniref:Uncharacterized protein n=1 Tax=Heyndrickxia camelliae TaxID=1707093 RepID=A0A2N3LDC5_9BACI|nr:hypothetical protein [Heyndrickxia camelliae]PKR82563.1 hypothetical protein CWO92_23555 [Heyndrickxia camelliae]
MAKKKYEVIHDFKDLQDKDKIYRVGDTYPQPINKKVEEKRLEELLSSSNKLGKPVIKEIE